jgi:hypothetical protein
MVKILDLEDKILDCWKITDDLNTLFTAFDLKEMDEDEIQNVHLGLITLYNLKFERLFDTFEKVLDSDPDIQAKRAKWDSFLAAEFLSSNEEWNKKYNATTSD